MNFIWFVCFFPHFFFFWKKLVDRLYLLGKSRIEVGIHLLSPQICCESDKRKKVSPKRCVIICFRWCVLRFFSNCNFNVCSYLFIVLWVFCLFSVCFLFQFFFVPLKLLSFCQCLRVAALHLFVFTFLLLRWWYFLLLLLFRFDFRHALDSTIWTLANCALATLCSAHLNIHPKFTVCVLYSAQFHVW